MNLNEYKDWNPKFYPEWISDKDMPENAKLHWAILEMCSESGEVLELAQKSVRKLKDIDKDKLKDELSDVFWGFTTICNIAGFTYEEIAEFNKNKLEERNK